MIADVVRPAELGGADVDAWRRVQRSSDVMGNPFLAPEFAAAVAEVRPAAQVAVLREGSATCFFPFERHRLGMARSIGAGMSDCQGVVAPPDMALDGQALLRACGLRLWRFDHLLGHQASVLAPGAAQVPSALIDLQDGFEAYLADRRAVSKTLVSTAERKARKLEREVGPLRFVADDRDHVLVDRVVAWKRDQYVRTGVHDVLAAPETGVLLHRLLDARSDTFSGLLSVLYAGDHPVAVHLGLRTPTVVAWWLPAYDPAFARYSPGLTLLLRLAAWAAGTGVRWIDLGKGDEPYKDRFRSADTHVADGILALPHARRSFELLRAARRQGRSLLDRRASGGVPAPA